MASRISTNFLAEIPNELYNRLNLLLQEKQARDNSDIKEEKVIAIAEKL